MATVSKYANAHTAITTGYTNPSNAYADDTNYATAAPGKNSEVSAYWGFPAFTTSDIPDNSTINSVTVTHLFKVSTSSSVADEYVQVFVNTTAQGTEQSNTSEPLTDTELSHQVTSGVTLTNLRTADVVRARTRSRRGNSNTAVTFSIDYVKITINYSPPTSPIYSTIDSVSSVTGTLKGSGKGSVSIDCSFSTTLTLKGSAEMITSIASTLNVSGTITGIQSSIYHTQFMYLFE